jgi:hypothetical protein
MVRWCEGGVNQGLLPMTISEEESIYSVHAIYWIALKAKGNDQSQAFGT